MPMTFHILMLFCYFHHLKNEHIQIHEHSHTFTERQKENETETEIEAKAKACTYNLLGYFKTFSRTITNFI